MSGEPSCHSGKALFSPWTGCDNEEEESGERYEGEGTCAASPLRIFGGGHGVPVEIGSCRLVVLVDLTEFSMRLFDSCTRVEGFVGSTFLRRHRRTSSGGVFIVVTEPRRLRLYA